MALRDDRPADALRRLPDNLDSGWRRWTEGRREFDAGKYAAAVPLYAAAIEQWKQIWQGARPHLPPGIKAAPRHPRGALPTTAPPACWPATFPAPSPPSMPRCGATPANARAWFLRARAKELAGHPDEALADYNLASRNAFAAAQDLASGEAHLYRGIALFRRRDFARAEQEFASSLNFEMNADPCAPMPAPGATSPPSRRASAGPARASLTQSLATVSPYFPRQEASSPRRPPAPWLPNAAKRGPPPVRGVLKCRVRWHRKASTK